MLLADVGPAYITDTKKDNMFNALTSRRFCVTICIMQGFGGEENGEKEDKKNTILG